MTRLLSVVLACGLGLLGVAPAEAASRAAVSITLMASASTVVEGSSVTFQGIAGHANGRTRVALQRRVDGSWQQQGRRHRVTATGHYRFTRTPPRGLQRYRVVIVAPTSQVPARSPAVSVQVTWQPTVTLTGTPLAHDDGSQWVHLGGTVTDGPAQPVVDLQQRTVENSTWTTFATFTPSTAPTGAAFEQEIPRTPRRLYRAVVRPTADTVEAHSDPVDSQASPYVLDLGHEITMGLPGSSAADATLDLSAGDVVTLAFYGAGDNGWHASVQAPDLTVVGSVYASNCQCGTYPYIRFTAHQSGTYVLHVGSGQSSLSLEVAASTPILLATTQDAEPVPYSSTLLGQEVDVTFQADAGDAFSVVDPQSKVADGFATETMVEPDGTTLPILVGRTNTYQSVPVFLADQTGTYTYRYLLTSWPGAGSVQILHASQATAVVDGDPVSMQVTRTGAVGLIWSDLATGDVLDVRSDQLVPTQVLMDQPGWGYLPEIVGQAGERLVVVRCCTTADTGPVTAHAVSPLELHADIDGDPAPYDLTGWGSRTVDVTFTGAAGQVVDPVSDARRGTWKLVDDQGTAVPPISGAFVLPADGTYRLRNVLHTDGPGSVSLRSVPVVDIPTDGTPTTLTLSHGDGVAIGRISAPAGTPIDATLAGVSDSLGTAWWAYVEDAQGRGIWYWTEAGFATVPPDTRPTFPMPAEGYVYVALLSDGGTGSAQVSAVVHPG